VRRRQRSNGGRILPLAFHLSTPSKHPRAAVPVERRYQMLKVNMANDVGAYGPRVRVPLF